MLLLIPPLLSGLGTGMTIYDVTVELSATWGTTKNSHNEQSRWSHSCVVRTVRDINECICTEHPQFCWVCRCQAFIRLTRNQQAQTKGKQMHESRCTRAAARQQVHESRCTIAGSLEQVYGLIYSPELLLLSQYSLILLMLVKLSQYMMYFYTIDHHFTIHHYLYTYIKHRKSFQCWYLKGDVGNKCPTILRHL